MPITHDNSNSWKTKASKLSVSITTNDNKNNNRAITFNKGVILSRVYRFYTFFTHLFLCNFSRLNSCDFFFLSGFLHRHWRFIGQQGKRGDHLLFHSTTSTRSRTLGHLFATLHVRWLSRIFNLNACVYQTATHWDLPPYRITIWVIDWWCNVCLLTWWINIRFLLQQFVIGNRWIWTRIDYHPCIQANRLTKCGSHPSVIFTELITQFRTYIDFFSMAFCQERIVVISDLFFLSGENFRKLNS